MTQTPDERQGEAAGAVSLHCPYFQEAVELVGRRWNGAILLAASRGATRYKEFIEAIPGLSERLLAQRLRELEDVGVLSREVAPTIPVQITYVLTTRGEELAGAMSPLLDWGQRWLREQSSP